MGGPPKEVLRLLAVTIFCATPFVVHQARANQVEEAALELHGRDGHLHPSMDLETLSLLEVNFSVTSDCDGHREQLPCTQGNDGNPDTCCTVPSNSTMTCDMNITFNNAVKAAILEINSKPLPDFLYVVSPNGEAFDVDRNGTTGDRAAFPVPNDVSICSCGFQTRRLCELRAYGRDHEDVQEVENKGLSIGTIAWIVVGAMCAVILIFGVACKKVREARHSWKYSKGNVVDDNEMEQTKRTGGQASTTSHQETAV